MAITADSYTSPSGDVVPSRTFVNKRIHTMIVDLYFPRDSVQFDKMPPDDADFFRLPQVEWFLAIALADSKGFSNDMERDSLIKAMYWSRTHPGNIAGISALYQYSRYMDMQSLVMETHIDQRSMSLIIKVTFRGSSKDDVILTAPAKVLIPSEAIEAKPRRMSMRKGLRGKTDDAVSE